MATITNCWLQYDPVFGTQKRGRQDFEMYIANFHEARFSVLTKSVKSNVEAASTMSCWLQSGLVLCVLSDPKRAHTDVEDRRDGDTHRSDARGSGCVHLVAGAASLGTSRKSFVAQIWHIEQYALMSALFSQAAW